MSDRVSVIFGGGRGIGAATARRLAAAGDVVVIADRAGDDPRLPYKMSSGADLEASVEGARHACDRPGSERVAGVVVDVTDTDAVEHLIAETEARYGGIDTLVITAGVIAGGVPLWEMPEGALRAVLEVDLEAVISVARLGIPALLRRPAPRSGRFVAVASAAGTRGLPLLAAYCAAKAGVLGLIRALAVELKGSGITVNAISPGSTDTEILTESARLYQLETSEHFASQQPIERLIAADEVAAMIAFLVGPDAAAITGANHAVDGGLSI